MYELADELFTHSGVTMGDVAHHPELTEANYITGDDVGPKFDSVAAAIMWHWSLDSTQDEDCGDAQYGNGWHALFRSERAVLHTGSGGFVSAWRLPDDADMDEEWAKIESGAVYEDDVCDEEEEA